MKQTIGFSQFCDEWNRWEDRKDTFSYKGKRALFDYLEEYEESTGEEVELDIVALCCDYSEYDSAWEAALEYTDADTLQPETDDEEEREKVAREWLSDRTPVIDVEGGGVIIQQF